MSNIPDNFCLNPFICTRQNAYDRVSPCAFGPVEIRMKPTDTQQVRWNAPELNALREKFIAGDKPAECKRCWDEENAGGQSLRLRTFDYHPTAYTDLIETSKWKSGPIDVVIKTSNVCNLACRSCAGWDSSYYWPEGAVYADQYNAVKNNFIQVRDKVYHRADLWTNDDLKNVKKLNFFGGEPLLDKEHPRILQRLVDNGWAGEITLFYSTNCQQRASNKLIELWQHFKKIEVFFSIDGMDNEFEYLRWPGKWSTTQQVVDWFLELPRKYPDVEWFFQGSQCVSLFNITSYWHTAKYLKETFGGVYFNIVDHPSYLRMTALPEEAKKLLADQIPDEQIRQYLFIEQSDEKSLKEFVIWTKRQDLYRKQDFTKVFPLTYEIISDYWNKFTDLNENLK
jgi:hypothetical protein